ncbi:MAG: hypothetical protein AABZ11_06005, partial [Nitrospinota bacterium]
EHMYEEAMNEYRRGLELNPNDILIKHGMANLMRNQKRYEEAFNLYQNIEKADKKREWLHLDKGIAYGEMGDIGNAIKELEIEERLYPGKADTHHQRGIIYRLQHYYNMALEEFKCTNDIAPGFEYVHHEMGITYREMGYIGNAIKELEIEERHYPGKIITLYNLYSAYESVRRKGEAIAGFHNILRSKMPSITIKAGCYFHLGRICMGDNRHYEAIKFFKRCLKIQPGHKKAKESLRQLRPLILDTYSQNSIFKGKNSYEYTDNKNSPILCI